MQYPCRIYHWDRVKPNELFPKSRYRIYRRKFQYIKSIIINRSISYLLLHYKSLPSYISENKQMKNYKLSFCGSGVRSLLAWYPSSGCVTKTVVKLLLGLQISKGLTRESTSQCMWFLGSYGSSMTDDWPEKIHFQLTHKTISKLRVLGGYWLDISVLSSLFLLKFLLHILFFKESFIDV